MIGFIWLAYEINNPTPSLFRAYWIIWVVLYILESVWFVLSLVLRLGRDPQNGKCFDLY